MYMPTATCMDYGKPKLNIIYILYPTPQNRRHALHAGGTFMSIKHLKKQSRHYNRNYNV